MLCKKYSILFDESAEEIVDFLGVDSDNLVRYIFWGEWKSCALIFKAQNLPTQEADKIGENSKPIMRKD